MTTKSTLFKLKYRCFRRQAFELARRLAKSQYWAEDQWHTYIDAKRKELVLHAFRESPFYAKLYGEAGFQAADVLQDGYFEQLPVLTKEHVRSCFDSICTNGKKAFLGRTSTGGSTGVPTTFGYDRRFPFESYSWRMLEWWGLHPWEDGAYVWRNPRVSWKARAMNQLLWWPTQKLRFDASSMSEQDLLDFITRFNALKPPLLQGYVGAIDEVARFILSQGMIMHAPRAIWLTSAPILPTQRHQIESAFNAPVYDQYGCCEAPNIAAQCSERGGLHVNAEWLSLEFVDDQCRPVTQETWGRTLLTKFDDLVFPLIRYEVGDMGRYLAKACTCGRTLPMIDSVKGRTTDIIRLPSGRVISGEYLTTIFDAEPDAVHGFRVIQHKDASLSVEYLTSDNPAIEQVVARVKATLEAKVNHEVPVCFRQVDAIPHDRGKLRFVIRET